MKYYANILIITAYSSCLPPIEFVKKCGFDSINSQNNVFSSTLIMQSMLLWHNTDT